MKASRKIIGVLLLLPTPFLLVALVWVSGMGQLISQPKKLDAISRMAIKSLPSFFDRSFQFALRNHSLKDKNAKEWIQSFHKANIKPSTLFRETGILVWTQGEVSNITGKLQQLFQGEPMSNSLSLEVSELKRSLGSRRVDALLLRLFKYMPSCSMAQLVAWRQYQVSTNKKGLPPACRLSKMFIPSIFRSKQTSIAKMPKQIQLIPRTQIKRYMAWFQYAGWVPWILFLLPGALILLGAAFGGSGLRGFFLWSGAATIMGGLLALPTPFLLKDVLIKSLLLQPWQASMQEHLPVFQPTLHQWLFQEVLPLFRLLTTPIFSSVETMGLTVCVVGVLFFGIGLFIRPSK